jgi:hypothetical protein
MRWEDRIKKEAASRQAAAGVNGKTTKKSNKKNTKAKKKKYNRSPVSMARSRKPHK